MRSRKLRAPSTGTTCRSRTSASMSAAPAPPCVVHRTSNAPPRGNPFLTRPPNGGNGHPKKTPALKSCKVKQFVHLSSIPLTRWNKSRVGRKVKVEAMASSVHLLVVTLPSALMSPRAVVSGLAISPCSSESFEGMAVGVFYSRNMAE